MDCRFLSKGCIRALQTLCLRVQKKISIAALPKTLELDYGQPELKHHSLGCGKVSFSCQELAEELAQFTRDSIASIGGKLQEAYPNTDQLATTLEAELFSSSKHATYYKGNVGITPGSGTRLEQFLKSTYFNEFSGRNTTVPQRGGGGVMIFVGREPTHTTFHLDATQARNTAFLVHKQMQPHSIFSKPVAVWFAIHPLRVKEADTWLQHHGFPSGFKTQGGVTLDDKTFTAMKRDMEPDGATNSGLVAVTQGPGTTCVV